MIRSRFRLLAAACALLVSPVSAQEPARDSTAVKQVEVGGQWFSARCAECHATNLSDPDFRLKWAGRNAYELFDRMRSTMPDSDPGSLTAETYVAIAAYLMKMNGMPAAPAALTTDSTTLAAIKLAFPSTTR